MERNGKRNGNGKEWKRRELERNGCEHQSLSQINRVGQNRIYTPYMTVDFVISL